MKEPEAHSTPSRVERPRLPCDPERSNVADLETGAKRSVGPELTSFLISGDYHRCRHLGARQVETVVHRMVDHHGDLRGTPNEVAAGMKGDDLGKTRELVKVRLWVRDFASPDLFPR